MMNCADSLEYSVTWQVHIILRVMVWMNGSTKHFSVSYWSLLIQSKKIGTNEFNMRPNSYPESYHMDSNLERNIEKIPLMLLLVHIGMRQW